MAGKRGVADLIAHSIAEQKTAAARDLATIPQQITELSRRFVALDRQLAAAARRIRELEARPAAMQFGREEAQRLEAVRGVRGMDVNGSAVRVETQPIVVAWGGHHYDLGAYCLSIDLAGDVRVESLERRGPKPMWDHPHIQGGLPCLGNLREGVLKLVAEYELALAVQVLIDFLRTYNPETAYAPIEAWPKTT